MDFVVLSVFFPLVMGFALLFVGATKRGDAIAFRFALVSSAVTLLLSLFVLLSYGLNPLKWQFGEFSEYSSYAWLPQLGINLTFGVDGISVPLVVLTTVTTLCSVLASKNTITQRQAFYYSLLLITESGVLGVFTSLNLFVFFIFWEIVLIPMFFLIGVWGGGRREYAAYKFLIYTHVGSVVMLIGIFLAYFSTNSSTFDLVVISKALSSASFPQSLKSAIFATLVFGFFVKMPIFPFHTWLPDAHVEAPSPVSVILAALLLKMGGYGLIRFAFEMIPSVAQAYAHWLLILGLVSALYASFVTFRQVDVKRMVALSSISHMGFVLIGVASLTPIGLVGAVFQMFSHGVIIGSLFLLAGFIGESTGTRDIPKLSGLAHLMPKLGGFITFASLAAVGLPGLSGFVGEYMIITSALSVNVYAGILTATVLAITLGYFTWMLQRVVFSEPLKGIQFHDLSGSELISLSIFAIFIIALGVYPLILQSYIAPSAQLIVKLAGW